MLPSSTSSTNFTGPLPALWKLALAFLVVYFGYGLNFLAIKIGVETMPPFFFAGGHVFLAGVIIMGYGLFSGIPFKLPPGGLRRAFISSFFLFVGGVGLVTAGEALGIASGMAAVIKASVPLWVAVFESVRPGGERVNWRVSVGLLLGASGVVLMVVPELNLSASNAHPLGAMMLMLSAILFAIGAIYVRHSPPSSSVVQSVAWQMSIGGCYLFIAGFLMGETKEFHLDDINRSVFLAFCFLLIVHSIAAFSALNWLLQHLPAPIVTTKFFVSPLIAVTAGALVLGELITWRTISSMVLILGGVGVILRFGASGHSAPLRPDDIDELED